MKRTILVLLGLVIVGGLIVAWLGVKQPVIGASVINLQSLNNNAGFARVDQPRDFHFPLDHGPHPEYQTEWWYYTGNVDSSDGGHFGFQLTFFRNAANPNPLPRTSDWATNQVYFAHFAITDVRSNSHFVAERYSRGTAGLAGASGIPYRVWLENWSVSSLSADGDKVTLHAVDSDHTLDLTLAADKPVVLHGLDGMSPKSDLPGDASYYYSFTRLATTGTIRTGGKSYAVQGLSWMDHEFGTTSLGPNAVGWDWFSIQLSDQREIMFFQIRNKDGSIEPLSGGTLVEPDGNTKRLARNQVEIKVLDKWKSPLNAIYPSRWTLSIPSASVELTLRPFVNDQEMRVSIPYWEGAVEVSGRSASGAVQGSGYVEMTGYVPTPTTP